MLGQAHHFLHFNQGKAAYAEERFSKEARRLYKVLDTRLKGRAFVADDFSVADIAIWPWTTSFGWQGIDLDDFPDVKRWYRDMAARPAFQKGYHVPKFTRDIPMP